MHVVTDGGSDRNVLDVHQVWLGYFALGGLADETATCADLHGIQVLAPGERNRLSVALAEHRGNLYPLHR